ncbi:GNAT family N-acetyltransferase [Streptococcus dentiloxodontae]
MAEQELLIEEAQPDDAAELVELLAAVRAESDFIISSASVSDLTIQQAQDFIKNNLENPNQICLLAKLGHTVLGIINVATADFEETNHIGDIFIAVRKDFWGHRIGSFLMEAVDDWVSHTPQISRLELTVQARNTRAINLYEKMGYVIEGVKKSGVKTKNGELLDVYLMAKLLNE